MEIWKDVVGYEGFYKVSNKGRVKSLPRTTKTKNGKLYKVSGKDMSIHISNVGYPSVRLTARGESSIHSVHRLVATAFIENPKNKAYVNHKDGIKTNNSLDNLEWSTPVENSLHAWENGLARVAVGEKHASSKLTAEDVRYIRMAASKYGVTRVSLSKEFGVAPQSIGDIVLRKTWKHII